MTEKFENLIAAIEELKEKVGIKKTIKDYGVDEKEFLRTLDEMTEMALMTSVQVQTHATL